MKRTIAYTAATLLASASLAVPAYSLDVGVGAKAGVGAQAGGNGNAGGSGNSGGIGLSGNVNAGAQAQSGGSASDDGSIDTGTTASTDADANFGLLISSMRSGEDSASQIGSMTEVSSVTVVNVDDLVQGNNLQAVENAKSENEGQIDDLQAAVGANAKLVAELEGQPDDDSDDIPVSDVIAANVEADGSVTLFVE